AACRGKSGWLLRATRADENLAHDLSADSAWIVGLLDTAVFMELVGLLAEGVLPASRFDDFAMGGGVGGNDGATDLASIQSGQPAVGFQGRLNSLEDWVEAPW